MKKILIIAAVVAMFLSSCGSNSASMKSEHDSVAYALGAYYGAIVANTDSTINIKTALAGFEAAFNKEAKMDPQEVGMFLQNYFTVVVPARELEASKEYLSEIEAKPNVKKTESGLLYEIIEAGDVDNKPMVDLDQVSVVYEGTLRDGRVFDSSKQRGDTVTFALNRVIRGWTEGLKLVGKGGKIVLYIPSELAYGPQGSRGSIIGPNQALKFEVDLVDVTAAAKE